jgi:hypothetical protein
MNLIIERSCNALIDWGPVVFFAALTLAMLLYTIYRVLTGVGLKTVSALEKPTQALMTQAQSMDRLTLSIQEYVHRDTNEHQEIIILQKVIREELKGIRDQSSRIEQHIGEINHGGPQIRNP